MSATGSDPETPSRQELATLDVDVRNPVLVIDDGRRGPDTPFESGGRAFAAGDLAEAFVQWSAGADAGDRRCHFNVAVLHERGLGVARDCDQASTAYRAAALLGLAAAMNNEACLIALRGDQPAAREWLVRASEAGNVAAIRSLAGLDLGDASRRDVAIDSIESAAKGGHPAALCALGSLHVAGIGVEQNDSRAFELFSTAAERSYPPALYRLAGLFFRGEGTPASAEQGRALLRRAANLGHEPAQCRLGRCYAEGVPGYLFDPVETVCWLELGRAHWLEGDAQAHATLVGRLPPERYGESMRRAGVIAVCTELSRSQSQRPAAGSDDLAPPPRRSLTARSLSGVGRFIARPSFARIRSPIARLFPRFAEYVARLLSRSR